MKTHLKINIIKYYLFIRMLIFSISYFCLFFFAKNQLFLLILQIIRMFFYS